jgi:hypothetical protein
MSIDLQKLAERGAAERVRAIVEELTALERAYPGASRGPRRNVAAPVAMRTAATPRRRRRKPMTAAQRKAVSGWMRKYWASRRKAAKSA